MHTDPLQQLIGTLKKSEKRYFRLFSSLQNGEKLYLKVFDLFDNKETPNTSSFILSEGKGKKNSWYSMAKNRTFNQVLNSLTDLHSDIHKEICDHFFKAEVLFNKELYKPCIKQLQKAKEIAIKNECFELALLTSEREYKIRMRTFFETHKGPALLQEQERILLLLQNAKSYYYLSQKIVSIYSKQGLLLKEKDKRQLSAYHNNPLLKNEKLALSIEAREFYYLSKSFICVMSRDYKKAYDFTSKRTHLYFDHPFKISKDHNSYLYVLNNAFITSLYAKKYDDFKYYLVKLDEIRPQLKHDTDKKAAFYMRNHELSFYHETNQWENAEETSRIIAEELPFYESTLNQMQRRVLFTFLAFSYLNTGKPKISIIWLNKLLYKSSDKIRIDQNTFYNIFYFIVQYEAGATPELLLSIFNSAFRYISTRDRMNSFYAVMKDFMKNYLLKEIPSDQLLLGFKNLKKSLLEIEKKSPLHEESLNFDFKPWVDMNIEKLSGK